MDCGVLTNPVNGSVDYTAGTTFRQTANYSCSTGYRLVGDSTQTCQATGNWSGSAPTCQSMLLLTLTHIYRGGVKASRFKFFQHSMLVISRTHAYSDIIDLYLHTE